MAEFGIMNDECLVAPQNEKYRAAQQKTKKSKYQVKETETPL